MNHCAVQQSAMAAYEEMRRPFVSMVSERRETILCPKPGRFSRLVAAADAIRPLRWHLGPQTEPCESRPGSDVLEMILAKGSLSDSVGSSPPYFCGSPPSRSTNPVVLDARFGDPAALSPAKTGGAAKAGPIPAAVRIEGFDCSRGTHGIAAFA